MPRPPQNENGKHLFYDLDTIIEQVHTLFEVWENKHGSVAYSNGLMLYRAKLAVHEWIANLVQFADFSNRKPEIRVEISPNGKSVRGIIEDNSSGFDLDAQLALCQQVIKEFPERGMGLLILQSITEEMSYKKVKDDTHRLEFTITEHDDPWLKLPI